MIWDEVAQRNGLSMVSEFLWLSVNHSKGHVMGAIIQNDLQNP